MKTSDVCSEVREGTTQLSPASKDRTARELVEASLIYTLEAGDVWLSVALYKVEMKYTSTHMSDACFSFHHERADVPYVIVHFSIKNSVVSFVWFQVFLCPFLSEYNTNSEYIELRL